MILQFIPILVLFLSGLLITLVSAFLSVKGFMLFLPDPELYYGILGLGIAFELAKISGSTFLFHRLKDKGFPWLLKFFMFLTMLSLIFFSSIFSFVHLNSSVSESQVQNDTSGVQISELIEQNKIMQSTIDGFNNQLATIDKTVVTARINLYNSLKPERDALEIRIRENLDAIKVLQSEVIENDNYKFLTSLSKATGVDRDEVFTLVILFLVIVIDPLAISIFISATYLYANREKKLPVLSTNVSYVPETSPMEYTSTVVEEVPLYTYEKLPLKFTETPIEVEEPEPIEKPEPIKEKEPDIGFTFKHEDVSLVKDKEGTIVDLLVKGESISELVDLNKDGRISEEELEAFINSDVFKRRLCKKIEE